MNEKRKLRQVKTLISNEIERRTLLEKCLRLCVDDVKAEIAKKKAEASKGKPTQTFYSIILLLGNKVAKRDEKYIS